MTTVQNKGTKPGLITDEDLRVLFPDRTVTLDTPSGGSLSVGVRPLSVAQIKRFQLQLASALSKVSISDIKMVDGEVEKESFRKLFAQLGPALVGELIDVIADSVTGIDIRSEACPHWVFPKIAAAWVEESFGDSGKVLAWVQAIEEVVTHMTGKSLSISETFSNYLSQRGIDSPTSLTTGQSPNSTTSPHEPQSI